MIVTVAVNRFQVGHWHAGKNNEAAPHFGALTTAAWPRPWMAGPGRAGAPPGPGRAPAGGRAGGGWWWAAGVRAPSGGRVGRAGRTSCQCVGSSPPRSDRRDLARAARANRDRDPRRRASGRARDDDVAEPGGIRRRSGRTGRGTQADTQACRPGPSS